MAESSKHDSKRPLLTSASGKTLPMNAMVFLFAKKRDNSTRVWYGVTDEIAVKILFRTANVNRRIRDN